MFNLIGNLIYPECPRCGAKELFGGNAVKNLQQLKKVGAYEADFDTYKYLCEKCWHDISHVKCSLCNRSFAILDNKKSDLIQNLSSFGIYSAAARDAKWACPECHEKEVRVACSRCSQPFHRANDCVRQYIENSEVMQYLWPKHPDYSTKWECLCPACHNACLSSIERVKKGLEQWIDGTKNEFVRGYRTIKKLEKVEIAADDEWCSTPDHVEAKLKLYSVQLGGNAFLKLHYRPLSHTYTIQKGVGPKGGKWFGRQTDRWYTGYAYAVLVADPRLDAARPSHSEAGPITCLKPDHNKMIIDGLNVCLWESGSKKPQLGILLTLIRELRSRGFHCLCYFDANTPHKIYEEGDKEDYEVYNALIQNHRQHFAEVPGGMRADDFILLTANTDGSIIISNDQYRDYLDRYDWLNDHARIIKGLAVNGRVIVPSLSIDKAIEQSVAALQWGHQ